MKTPKKLGLVGKVLLGVGALVNSANADDYLVIKANAPSIPQTSYVYNKHIDGASEGVDGSDASYIDIGQKIKFYSRNPLCSPDRLKVDARPLESMTTFINEFDGFTLSGSTDVNIAYQMAGGEFSSMNVISRLTDGSDNTIEIYDAKQCASHYPNYVFSIIVNNGITKKLKTEFYATADLNIDGIVNQKDYAILSKNWLQNITRTDVYNPDIFADISGINGLPDGKVDFYDLAEMQNQWLEEKIE